MGETTRQFEERFSEVLSVKHAIAVSSCTAALHLANQALGIGRLDEVICPALSFVAGAHSIRFLGAIPVFADIQSLDDLCISPSHIEDLINPATRAIQVVHFAGSRRIDDTVERDRLVGLVQQIGPPSGRLILRTAAAGAARAALADDLARLVDRWAEIEAARHLASSDGAPARLDRPLDPISRYLERTREPPDLVVIDDPALLAEARRACADTAPDMRLHQNGARSQPLVGGDHPWW